MKWDVYARYLTYGLKKSWWIKNIQMCFLNKNINHKNSYVKWISGISTNWTTFKTRPMIFLVPVTSHRDYWWLSWIQYLTDTRPTTLIIRGKKIKVRRLAILERPMNLYWKEFSLIRVSFDKYGKYCFYILERVKTI